jgi:hypothetical protein
VQPCMSVCGVQVCEAHGRWSTTKVKVIRVRADGLGVTKDERWDSTRGTEEDG